MRNRIRPDQDIENPDFDDLEVQDRIPRDPSWSVLSRGRKDPKRPGHVQDENLSHQVPNPELFKVLSPTLGKAPDEYPEKRVFLLSFFPARL